MSAHDNDIGLPDPLRLKVFGPEPMSTEERLGHLIELVGQLDDRIKDLERGLTDLLVPNKPPEESWPNPDRGPDQGGPMQ